MKRRRSSAREQQGPRLEPLEQRVLFSADLPFLTAANDSVGPEQAGLTDTRLTTEAGTTDATNAGAAAAEPARELVIIDGGTPDAEAIAEDIRSREDADRFEVFILDTAQDGLTQVSSIIEQFDGLSALHLISHGDSTGLELGDGFVTLEDLLAHANDLVGWQDNFTGNADILLYGCDLAASEEGLNFIETLGQLTATDVAASEDRTGHALLGGDWDLEYESGAVETQLAVSVEARASYGHTLSLTPDGTNQLINETTSDVQKNSDIGVFADGRYVVVWDSLSDGDGEGVYLRIFNANGSETLTETRVDQTTASQQTDPTVAVSASGNFVVTWTGTQGGSTDVYARVYDANGTALTNEFLVNTGYTTGEQFNSDVAIDDSGNFVITWQGEGAGDADGIYAQRYDSAGIQLGSAFRVNTSATASGQEDAAVAMNGSGDFVITWTDRSTGSARIAAQQFTAAGAGQGEFVVHATNDAQEELLAAVAMDDAGNFVVAWGQADADGSGFGIEMQRFDANGNRLEADDVAVNTTTLVDQVDPSIAMAGDGTFVISWTSTDQDGDAAGIVLQQFDAGGAKSGGEQIANSYTISSQQVSQIAMNDTGTVVVTWEGEGAADSSGIFAQRYLRSSSGAAVWSNTTATPQTSTWDGSSFGATSSTATLTDRYRTMQGADAPTRDEKLVVGVDALGNVTGAMWDGTSWSALSLGTLGSVSETYWGGADVAYEQLSGDGLLVWNDNSQTAGQKLRFAVWDGTGWTTPQSITDYTGAEPQHLELVFDPGSDSMMLVVNDVNADDHVLVWDGSAWGNAVTLDTSGTAEADQTAITVAFEAQTGDALVMYGKNGDSSVHYRIWDGSSWGVEASLAAPAGTVGEAKWLVSASDYGSDRIALGVMTSDGDVYLSVWDGDAWEAPLLAETTTTGTIYPNLAVAFEGGTGDALAVYGESGQNTFRYRTWDATGGWSSEGTGPNFGAAPNSMTLDADPNSAGIMLSVQDNSSDLHYVLWTGSSWGTANELSTNTGETKNWPFTFIYDQDGLLVQANSAPINSIPGTQTTAVDTPLVFSAGNGNAISISDADDTSAEVTLSSGNGTLTLAGTTGLTFSAGDGSADATMTFTGTIVDINAALDGLTYAPTATFEGYGAIDVTTTDLGAGGGGGPKSDTDSVSVEIGDVNTPPVNSMPASQTIDQNGMLLFASGTGTAISITDPDAGGSAVEVTLTATNGTLSLPTTRGLTLTTGDGTDDAVITVSGTIDDINTALEGMTFVAAAGFTGSASVQISTDDLGNSGAGGALSDTDTVAITVQPPDQSLWLTFENDEGGTGNSDIPSISGGDVATFSDITQLETSNSNPLAATTSGTFGYSFNLDAVLLTGGGAASDGNTRVNAVHYVTRDIQVGSNNIQLQAGDVLFSTDADESLAGVTYNSDDVVVFRPDTPGDYSQGSFFLLIDGNGSLALNNVTAISLVEQTTSVGGVTLNQGDFLLTHGGDGRNILHYTPGTLGATTSGSTSILVAGADINIGQDIGGVHLIQADTELGGVSLTAGQLLVSIQGDDSTVGSGTTIDVLRQDIFALDVSATGNGTSVATASRLFEGLDENLDVNNESIWGIGYQGNAAPSVTAATFSVDENSANTTVVGTVTANDPEDGTLSYAIVGGNTDGAFTIDAASGAITVATSAALDFEATSTFSLSVAAIDPEGAYGTATITIDLNNLSEAGVNDAPVIGLPGTQTIDQNGMLLLSTATATGISISDFDADGASVEVTLTATSGTLNLSGTRSLSFTSGDGNGDVTMTFTGALADINAALEGATFVADAGYTGAANVEISVNDLGNTGTGGAQTTTGNLSVTVQAPDQSLWLTFENDEGGTGNSDIPSISGGDVATFSDITQLETSNSNPLAATTSGTFGYSFTLDTVLLTGGGGASDGNTKVNAVHYVTRDIQVASNNIQLLAGDLILSTNEAESIGGVTYEKEDVFVFRPDSPGDYSQGSFFRLIDGKNDTGWGNVSAIALVEETTTVGGVTLNAGEFLVAHDGSGKNILHFTPGSLGDTTTGTTSILVAGTDVDIGQNIGGLHVVQADSELGGVSLTAGQLLVSIQGDDSTVGSGTTIDVLRQDIFALDVSATGNGTSVATASRLFEGLDENLDVNNESIWGIGYQGNAAPSVTAATFSVDENSANTTVVGTVTANDPEDGTLSYAIVGGNTDGAFTIDAASGEISVANSAALDFEVTPTFNLTVAAIDPEGAYDTANIRVDLNDVNEPPTVDLDGPSGAYAPAFVEDSGAVSIADTDATITDAGSTLVSMTVTISTLLDGADEVLTFDSSGTGILGSYNAGTGVLSLSGTDNLANYQQVLRTILYENASDAPDITSRAISVVVNNGTFDSNVATSTVTVAATNDAPSGATASLFPAINEDDFTSTGKPVSDFTTSTADPDAGAVYGIAVTGANNSNGQWQYTLDGSTWNNIGTVSESSALLLPSDGTARVRFVPDADFNAPTVSPFQMVAWDQTSGNAGDYVDASVRGGSTAFSTNSTSVSVAVDPVNDAPVATGGTATLAAVNEDTADPGGATVTSLFSELFDDSADEVSGGSSADALAGIAIVANAADATTEGTWQWHDGSSWTDISESASTGSALILDASTLIRFLPDSDYSGTPGTLTARLMDDSAGAVTSGSSADLTTSGGTTAYSDGSSAIVLSTTISPVNDDPTFTSPTGYSVAENSTAVGTVTSADVDGGAPSYSLVGAVDDSLFTIDASTGALSFNTAPDFEAPADAGTDNIYDLTVQVDDGNSGIVTQAVSVTVTNINEGSVTAISDSDGTADTVSEDASVGTTVGITAFADDADTPDSVSYSLDDDAGGLFAIDTNTGVVTLNGSLDYEAATSHAITVRATSTDTSASTRVFTITVGDVNDNAPVVTPGQTFSVAEDAAASDSVGTVIATDPDSVGALQGWTITAGNGDGIFAIDANSGEITIADPTNLDYEQTTQYSLTVRVGDGTNTSATETVVIDVTDVNETPTTTGIADLSLDEDAGFSFIDLNAIFEDQEDPDTALVYSVTSNSNPGLFDSTAINGSGVLTLDYAADQNGFADLTVRATDTGGEFVETTFRVTVNPVNDAPVRTGGTVSDLVVLEDSGLTSLGLGTVSYGAGGGGDESAQTLSYEVTVIPDPNTFGKIYLADGTTQVTTGVYTLADIEGMQFAPQPDTTGGPSFFSFQVTDSGGTGNGGSDTLTETIQLDITAVNDDPVFTSPASFSVAENTPAVGTVTSTDVDGGAPTYSLVGAVDDGLFTINATTGDLSFNTAPDFEAPVDGGSDNVYDLTVQVDDGNGGVVTQAVSVTVTDANESNVTAISDSNGAADSVSEDAGVGATVGVTAFADDADGTDTVSYSLDDNAGGLFVIDSNTGVVTLNGALDYEAATSHDITVRATSTDTSFSTRSIAIAVGDVNDTAPVVTPSQTFSVAEDAAATTVVGTVAATDADTVGTLQGWTITAGNGDDVFSINASSGEITVADPTTLDYETTTQYTLTVQVSDGVNNSATETVVIDVTDVNDEQVLATNTGATVAEGSTGNVVTSLMLETTDVDNTTGELVYTVNTAPANGTLSLNGTALAATDTFTQADIDGGLVTYDHDDSETSNDSFDFAVDDGAGTASSGTFSFTITPVNDNAPVITSDGGGATAALNVAENTTAVTTVTATDADLPAQTLSYTITGGTDAGRFTIDGNSGALSFVAAPDFEAPLDSGTDNIYEVVVEVSDGQGSTDSQTISVTITDADEGGVTALSDTDGTADTVSEDASVGATAGVTAFADDADGTDTVSYSLDDDAGGLFVIDSNTGVVTLNGALDYETATNHDITVRATSTDTSSSTRTFSITVGDVNDNAPVVTPSQTFSVAEDAAATTVVGTVAATDADTVGALQGWTITAGNGDGIFAIDANSGEITVADPTNLDYETTTQYTLTIHVADGTNTSATETVVIDVTDVNDEQVLETNTGATVAEGSTGNVVTTLMLETTDVDNTAGELVYTVSTGPANGTLRLNGTALAANDTFTQADIDGGLVTYDHDGSETTADTFDFAVDDGAGTATSGTFSFTVTPVNDDPTNSGSLPTDITVTEDVASAVDLSAMNLSDLDAGGGALTLTLTTSTGGNLSAASAGGIVIAGSGTGVLTLTGTQADLNAYLDAPGNLTYLHATADLSGNDADTIDVAVTDNGNSGAGGGGTISLGTVNVDITAVNDDPLLTLAPGGDTYLENAAGTLIDGTATVSDADGLDFAGGQLTVSIAGNGTVNDRLAVIAEGNGPGQVDVVGSSVRIDGVEIATVAGGTGAGDDLVVTFNANADAATVEQVARRIAFSNLSDDPSSLDRTLTMQLTDGDGGTSALATRTISVTPVNDAPAVAVNNGATVAEGGSVVITTAELDSGDPDDASTGLVYTLTAAPANGRIELSTDSGVSTLSFTQDDLANGHVVYVHDGSETSTDSFDFSLADGGEDGALPATGTFSLSITPVNDNAPVITSDGGDATAALSVAENMTAVTTVTATDADLPAQTLSYAISGGTDAGRFTIDSNSGALSFVAAPDFEAPLDSDTNNIYEVVVEVSDGQGSTDSQTLSVTVTDADEGGVTALSDSDGTTDTVSEDATVGATVGVTAFADDADGSDTVSYSLDDDAGGLFVIDSNTGVVTLDGALDYEATISHDITVRATSTDTTFSNRTFSIAVIDVNDNAPVATPSQTFSVAEDAAASTAVGTVAATDADTVGTLQGWTITAGNGDGIFAIDANSGEITVADPTSLDYETTTQYTLTVQVSDGANSSATEAVVIDVTDVNDEQVLATNTGATVAEGSTGNVVTALMLETTDVDNTTGELVYTVSTAPANGTLRLNGTALAATDTFTQADIDGGLVTYDHDGSETSTDSFDFAVDDGAGTASSGIFSFAVTPVNDDPTVTSPASFSVAENNTAVGTVTSTDVDGGTPTYSLVGAVDDGLFTIDATTGALSFDSAPDFEAPADAGTDNIYDLTVQVDDGNGGIVTQTVSVTVTNLNEGGVTAISDSNGAADLVSEAATFGTTLGVTAFADDTDTPDTVSYSLDDDAGGLFVIDANTGVVTLNGSLDYEAATSHDITVRATSTDTSFSTRTFTIAVGNVNDNAPVITPGQTFAVAENATVSSVVGTVAATDADTVGTLQGWTITAGNGDGIFAIDATSGEITVADPASLDYETTTQYTLTVQVADGTNTSVTETVVIDVTDVNEAPVFDSAPVTSATEDALYSYTVSSSDVDGDALSITGITLPAWLTLTDNGDGTAVLSGTPTDAEVGDHAIELEVSDGSLTATQSFTLNVANVNDDPVFTSPAAFSVVENSTTVGTVTSTDVDGGAPTYSLVGAVVDGLFTINADTGALSFNAAPDFEAPADAGGNNVYDLTVQVDDGNGGIAVQNVSVSVTNVDDANTGPIADTDSAADAVAENTPAGAPVGVTAFAEDTDFGDTVAYSLAADAGGRFTIDTATGVVTTTAALDFEAAASYGITVQATSSDGSSATRDFTVNVLDLAEAPTDLQLSSSTVAEFTDTTGGYAVGTLTTLDPDAGDAFTYAITGGLDADVFQLGGVDNDELLLDDGALDFERQSVYEVTLSSTDSSGRSIERTFAIQVVDRNDAPDVQDDLLTTSEDTELLIDVAADLLANDTDADGDTLTVVELSQPRHGILIDNQDGSLRYQPDADYNGEDQFSYVVADGNGATRSADVRITVLPVNDTPVLNTTGPLAIGELDAAGGLVTTLTATDPDQDTLGYALTGGADADAFELDPATGELRFRNTADFENPSDTDADNRFEVSVRVEDGQGGAQTRSLTVELLDQNEAPTVADRTLTTSFEQSGRIGVVEALDPDAGDTLRFEIVSGSGAQIFAIGAEDGEIRQLRTASPGSYVLDVLVTDSGGQTSRGQLSIRIAGPAGGAIDGVISGSSTQPGGANGTTTTVDSAAPAQTFTAKGLGDDSGEPATVASAGSTGTTGTAETSPPNERESGAPASATATPAPLVQAAPGTGETSAANTTAGSGPSIAPSSGQQGAFRSLGERGYSLVLELLFEERESVEVASVLTRGLFQIDAATLNATLPPGMLQAMEDMLAEYGEAQAEDEERFNLVVNVGTAAAVSLTAGFVSWLLRTGSLLTTLMSTSPLWRSIDPIPVLAASGDEAPDSDAEGRADQ